MGIANRIRLRLLQEIKVETVDQTSFNGRIIKQLSFHFDDQISWSSLQVEVQSTYNLVWVANPFVKGLAPWQINKLVTAPCSCTHCQGVVNVLLVVSNKILIVGESI